MGYYDEGGTLVATKTRTASKDFKIKGDWKSTTLFGQQLFSKGGLYITITEGEKDAASVYQMTGSRYPAVSIKNGAGSALRDCKANFEWLDSFKTIVLCFDADEVGQQASKEVAELFGDKVKVFKHAKDYKDASDYLKSGEGKTFSDLWWKAEDYVPSGIVAGADMWELVSSPLQLPDVCYPWQGLNELTYGMRMSDLVTITDGSGLGKSQLLREMFSHIVKTTDYKIGGLFLEENIQKTALSIMSMEAGMPLHLPSVEFTPNGWFVPTGEKTATPDELRDYYDKQLNNDRIFLFDHFGSTAIDNIIGRIKYMAKAKDCKVVFLDHISIVISSQENGDERKALDEIMTRLRMVAQEMNILVIAVSHLKRPDGKGHEDGAATSLSQLRGSGSIAQLSDCVIGLERDSQNDDAIIRNTTIVRVLKNRFSGDTGKACSLLYNKEDGRMTEYVPELEEL
jgi:twinkle protein